MCLSLPSFGDSQGESKGTVLKGGAEVVAEEAVDEGIDGTVQGWQVLNYHGCVEALFGLGEDVEVVQDIKQKVGAPTESECCRRDRRAWHEAVQLFRELITCAQIQTVITHKCLFMQEELLPTQGLI